MKNTLLLSILAWVFIVPVMGQDMFQRTYPTNDMSAFTVLDGATDGDMTYVLATMMPDEPGESEALLLAAFDLKGDEVWKRKIMYIDTSLLDIGSLILGSNDSLYFTSMLEKEGGEDFRILNAYNKNGSGGNATLLLTENSDGLVKNHILADGTSRSYFSAFTYQQDMNADSLGMVISRISYDTGAIYHQGVLAFDTLGGFIPSAPQAMQTVVEDSTIMIAGVAVSGPTPNAYITKIDSNGVVNMSRRFFPANGGNLYSLTDALQTADSTFLICGANGGNGFIAAIDFDGTVLWSKEYTMGNNNTFIVKHVDVNPLGVIVASGVMNFSTGDSIHNVIMHVDGGGNIIASNKMNRVNGINNTLGDLAIMNDGGSMIFTSGTEIDDINYVPMLIKSDTLGQSMCHDTVSFITSDLPLLSDTMIWSARSISVSDSILVIDDGQAIEFDIPTLSLNVRPFCPNEPIDWTFDPNVQGATMYLWSDASTADTLRVIAEGEYSVTVTVDENLCFSMCDTAMLAVYEEPELLAFGTIDNFCENGMGDVIAQYQGEAPLDSIVWSTGAINVNRIMVPTSGSYGVTMTDICGLTADTLIQLTLPDLASMASIDLDPDFCGNNGILLSASADGDNLSFLWSTNESTSSIIVNQPGEYTVSVTDFCGNVFTATQVVDPDLIDRVSNIQVISASDLNCVVSSLDLTATFAGEASSITWSTGESSETINVSDPGLYSVTVTGFCPQNILQGTIEITECPECLRYPQVFFPQGMEDSNQSFGPLIECTETISEYELKVYNRWGQQVFESTSIDNEWDGRHGGDFAPSGVYVYYAKFNIGEGIQMIEGDVTLIR